MQDTLQKVVRAQGIRQNTIQGEVYQLKTLPADAGLAVFVQIVTLLQDSLGALFDGIRIDQHTMPEENMVWTRVMMALTPRLLQQDVVGLVKDLVSDVTVNGSDIDFNTHFSANYDKLMLVAEWVFRENFYESFMNWLKAKGFEIPTLSQVMPIQGATEEDSENS